MNIFYAPDITSDLYTLGDEESKHCSRVLRLTPGDKVQLINGKGTLFVAEIIETKPRCILKVVSKTEEFEKRPFYLHMAISPLKNNDRFEWFVEKAVELGIDEISPIICEHTERKNVNLERINRIVVSAIKQSIKAYEPTINQLSDYKTLVKKEIISIKLIAHCEKTEKFTIPEIYKPSEKVTILIGPEGDFSVNEINMAIENGYKPITLGTSRLRTETAGVKACAVVNFLNGI